jgi:stage II sporulation protein M
MFSRKGLLSSWQETKPYFIFSVILFFAGFILGGVPDSPEEWLSQQLRQIAEISRAAERSGSPEFVLFMTIFTRNLFAAILSMASGIIAGIIPIVILVNNGMIMGYLLSRYSDEGENIWMIIAKGILPHGILELAAIFLASAFGLRFGLTLLKSIGRVATGKPEPWHSFVRTAIGSVPAVIVIVILLFCAAIVESTITFWLMR